MRLSDIGTGLLGVGVGLWLAYAGHDLGLGDLREPGSGFILFWVGLIMAALSAILAGAGSVGSRASADGAGSGAAFGEHWQKVPLVLVYLVVYANLLDAVGFIPLTIVLLVLLFKTVQPQTWTVAILYSVAITLTVYVIFGIGLGTQLPAGLLEPLLVG